MEMWGTRVYRRFEMDEARRLLTLTIRAGGVDFKATSFQQWVLTSKSYLMYSTLQFAFDSPEFLLVARHIMRCFSNSCTMMMMMVHANLCNGVACCSKCGLTLEIRIMITVLPMEQQIAHGRKKILVGGIRGYRLTLVRANDEFSHSRFLIPIKEPSGYQNEFIPCGVNTYKESESPHPSTIHKWLSAEQLGSSTSSCAFFSSSPM